MSASNTQQTQVYRPEEVQQILQIAIARQDQNEEFSREQLGEIATELGIEQECLQAAEQDWCNQQLLEHKQEIFNSYRKDKFKQKAVRYVIINTFLISLNLLSTGSVSWTLYVLLIWGLFLSLSAWRTFQSKGEEYEQAFQSWERKYELKRSIDSLWDKFKQILQP